MSKAEPWFFLIAHRMATVLFIHRKSPILLRDLAMPSLIFLALRKNGIFAAHKNLFFFFKYMTIYDQLCPQSSALSYKFIGLSP